MCCLWSSSSSSKFKIIHFILSESLSNGDGGSYNDGENGQQNEEDAQEEYN